MCKDDNGRYFDLLMTKIDLKSQYYELYNFYKMQIVKNNGKNIYILLTRWGRIGEDGQTQETPFPTLVECKVEFAKVFKAKTKNEWANIDQFEPQKGRYKIINRERRYKNIYKKIKYGFKSDEEVDGLDRSIQKMMEDGSRPSEVCKLMRDCFMLQVSNTPYGFIPSAQLNEASAVLKKLKEALNRIDGSGNTLTFASDNDEYSKVKNRIWDLSAELYHLIPQSNFTNTKIQPLSKRLVEQWENNIRNLKELEVVNRIMAASQLNSQTMHPLKYMYQSLDCHIEKHPPHSEISQYLLRNIAVSSIGTTVRGIFQLNRSAEASIQASAGKQWLLLFHGIKTGGLLSILKRGLQNAPYGVFHGMRFGEGVYLTDNIEKANNYDRHFDNKSSDYILAVSISTDGIRRYSEKEIYRSWNAHSPKPPKNAKTVWIVGKNYQDFSKTVVLPNGCILGLGEWKNRVFNSLAERKYKEEREEKERKRALKQKKNVFQFEVASTNARNNSDNDEDEDYSPGDSNSDDDSKRRQRSKYPYYG